MERNRRKKKKVLKSFLPTFNLNKLAIISIICSIVFIVAVFIIQRITIKNLKLQNTVNQITIETQNDSKNKQTMLIVLYEKYIEKINNFCYLTKEEFCEISWGK